MVAGTGRGVRTLGPQGKPRVAATNLRFFAGLRPGAAGGRLQVLLIAKCRRSLREPGFAALPGLHSSRLSGFEGSGYRPYTREACAIREK